MRNAVVIVGSGMMGAGIAARSAAAGRRTILVDTCLERAQRGGTKAAGLGCIVVVIALIALLGFTLVSGVSILSAM